LQPANSAPRSKVVNGSGGRNGNTPEDQLPGRRHE
jgi:hypothetical protein